MAEMRATPFPRRISGGRCRDSVASGRGESARILGYFGLLSASTGPFMVLAGMALFFLSAVAGDYFRVGRVHPLTAALAILSFLFLPTQAIVGDSAAWHHFATRLAR
jgi:hypothetical protein